MLCSSTSSSSIHAMTYFCINPVTPPPSVDCVWLRNPLNEALIVSWPSSGLWRKMLSELTQDDASCKWNVLAPRTQLPTMRAHTCQQTMVPTVMRCYGSSTDDDVNFNCTNLYMSLGMLTFVPCQNASSDNRLLCVNQCPPNTVQSGMECVCRNGTFLAGTECVPCVDGCTQCVNGTQAGCLVCPLRQQGVCVVECRNGH